MKLTILIILLFAGTVFAQSDSSLSGVRSLEWMDGATGTVIMTCEQTTYEADKPWMVKKVAGCKLSEGHTLDELVQGTIKNIQQTQVDMQALRDSFMKYLKSEDKTYQKSKAVKGKP